MTNLSNSTRNVLTALLVVVLGLVAGWTVLVSQQTAADVVSRSAAQADPTATPTDSPTDAASGNETEFLDEGPLVTYQVYINRDPFEPVVPVLDATEPTGTPGGAPVVPGVDPSASPTPTTSPVPGSPVPSGSPTPTPSGSPTPGPSGSPTPTPSGSPTGGCVQSAEVVCSGQEVVLVDVFTDGDDPRVRVRVDGQVYDVAKGDRFASSFEVVSVNPPCATFLFGDDAFTLCEGESTLK